MAAPDLDGLLASARGALPAYIDDLQHLVGIDSGTPNAEGVNKVADAVVERLMPLPWQIERFATGASGDVVVAHGRSAQPRVVLLGHLDTVFADGEAARRPFRVDADGRARGPGVSDDKGGILAGVLALRLLADRGVDLDEVALCLSPDEEVGSPTARGVIERLAAGAQAVLSLECARENGALVRARKGVTDVRIELHGRAAHAGIEPERGADAALAAAKLVIALAGVPDEVAGCRVNVGVIRAGERVNVVCDAASVALEIRAATARTIEAAVAAVRRAATRVADDHGGSITATVHLSAECPPWEERCDDDQLVALAVEVGRAVGVDVTATRTGGVADANYAAATGTATLDGLGPVGGDDHSAVEWLDTTSVAPRVALLAGMLARLVDGVGARHVRPDRPR